MLEIRQLESSSPRIPCPIHGFAGPFHHSGLLPIGLRIFGQSLRTQRAALLHPVLYPHPSCANRLQLAGSKEVCGEGLAGLTGQSKLGFPENSSHPKVA